MNPHSLVACAWGMSTVVSAGSLASFASRPADSSLGMLDLLSAFLIFWMLCTNSAFVWGYVNSYIRDELEDSLYQPSYVLWDAIEIYFTIIYALQLSKGLAVTALALCFSRRIENRGPGVRGALLGAATVAFPCSLAKTWLILSLASKLEPRNGAIKWHLIEMLLEVMTNIVVVVLLFTGIKTIPGEVDSGVGTRYQRPTSVSSAHLRGDQVLVDGPGQQPGLWTPTPASADYPAVDTGHLALAR